MGIIVSIFDCLFPESEGSTPLLIENDPFSSSSEIVEQPRYTGIAPGNFLPIHGINDPSQRVYSREKLLLIALATRNQPLDFLQEMDNSADYKFLFESDSAKTLDWIFEKMNKPQLDAKIKAQLEITNLKK